MGYFIQISVGQESFQRPQEDIPSAFLILRFKDCCLILQCVEIGLHSKSPSFKQKIDTRRKPLVKMETFIFQKISGKNQGPLICGQKFDWLKFPVLIEFIYEEYCDWYS